MRRCFCAPAPPAALESDLENTRELTFGPGLGSFRSTRLNVTGNSSRSHSVKTEKCNKIPSRDTSVIQIHTEGGNVGVKTNLKAQQQTH